MKKQYISPVANSVNIGTCQIICESLGRKNIPTVNYNDAIIDNDGKAADARFGFFDDEE